MTEILDTQRILAAVDAPPFSEFDTAIPPFGSPLRARWDWLCEAAVAYCDLVDGGWLLVDPDAPSIEVAHANGHPVVMSAWTDAAVPAGRYIFVGGA